MISLNDNTSFPRAARELIAKNAQVRAAAIGICEDHPELERFPKCRLEDYETIKASIERHGITTPLLAHEQRGRVFIIEGRARLAVARELGIEAVPVIVNNEFDAEAIGMENAIARKTLTASTRALILLEAHPELCQNKALRKTASLAKGVYHEPQELPSFRKLEERYKLPEGYLRKLDHVRGLCSPERWEEERARILAGEISVTSLFNAINGWHATADEPKRVRSSKLLLERNITQFNRWSVGFEKLSATEQHEVAEKYLEAFRNAPLAWQERIAPRWVEALRTATASKKGKRE